jgi:hypothetical protein
MAGWHIIDLLTAKIHFIGPAVFCDIRDLGDLLSLNVGPNLLNAMNMNRGMPTIFLVK